MQGMRTGLTGDRIGADHTGAKGKTKNLPRYLGHEKNREPHSHAKEADSNPALKKTEVTEPGPEGPL